MYIFIKRKTKDTKETLCLVQAAGIADAVKLAEVSPNNLDWVYIENYKMSEFADVENGVLEKEF